MLKIYLIATNGISPNAKNALLSSLPPSLYDRASRQIGGEINEERVCAYALVERLISDVGAFASAVTVCEGERGKPYIKALPGGFSISHTSGLAMLAYNSSGEIGCDAEDACALSCERIKKIEDRFLKKYVGEYEVLDDRIEIRVFTATDEGCLEEVLSKDINDPEAFTKAGEGYISRDLSRVGKWTLAEALLKLDGGGFSSLCSIEKIEKSSHVFASRINFAEGNYDIAIAINNEILP